MPTGIDQSYDFADPAAAKAAGVLCAMMYLSRTPGKNATAQKVRAYHAVGIGVFLGWEATATRALEGYAAGVTDGNDAAAQYLDLIRETGHVPHNLTFIAPAYDFDTNPGQYPAIDAYARGFAAGLHGRFGEGAYGEADLLDHEHLVGLLEGGGFGTYAWSGGRISEWDDFHQFLNGQHLGGASVDFDTLINPIRLGAWWPPGSKYDIREPSPWEDNEVISADGMKQISDLLDKKLYARGVADRDELIALGRAIVNGVASGEFNEKHMANVVGDGGLAAKVEKVGAAVAAK